MRHRSCDGATDSTLRASLTFSRLRPRIRAAVRDVPHLLRTCVQFSQSGVGGLAALRRLLRRLIDHLVPGQKFVRGFKPSPGHLRPERSFGIDRFQHRPISETHMGPRRAFRRHELLLLVGRNVFEFEEKSAVRLRSDRFSNGNPKTRPARVHAWSGAK